MIRTLYRESEHASVRRTLRSSAIKVDRLILGILYAHLPFSGFLLSEPYGTVYEGFSASLIICAIGTISYILYKGTLFNRILNGLLLALFSILLISIQFGSIEMHFHVFITLPFLLLYRDWRVYPGSVSLIALHHIIYNYLQEFGISISGFPLIVFNDGTGWHLIALHLSFVLIEASMMIYFAISLRTQYVTLLTSNEILNHTISSKLQNLRSEIEKRKTSESKLKESNRELEQFAYVASHDLQEPLRMISSYLQLLQRRYKDHLDEKGNEFIFFAVDGAQRMSKMISSLLEYSRVGRSKSNFSNHSLNEILSNALKNLEIRIENSNAVIESDPLPEVSCDPELIERLLQNLIGNALKFIPKERTPEIKIRYQGDAQNHILSIQDNGIGIPEDQIENIFQIFKRLHASNEYEGTGIGLSVCKKIVEIHSGKIWVTSEVGQGTTFHISIPKEILSNSTQEGGKS